MIGKKEMIEALGLPPLTNGEIETHSIPSDRLWILRFKEVVVGPFETGQLFKYSRMFPAKFSSFETKKISSPDDQWAPFFACSEFERRTQPSLGQVEEEAAEIFILYQGQKFGPHSLEEIKNFLTQKIISHQDLLSLDQGKNWKKIYQHTAFDRRGLSLPNPIPAPHSESIQSGLSSPSEISTAEGTKTMSDVVANLALIEKKAPAIVIALPKELRESSNAGLGEKIITLFTQTRFQAMAASFVLILVSTFFFFTGDQQSDLGLSSPPPSLSPVAEIQAVPVPVPGPMVRKPAFNNQAGTSELIEARPSNKWTPPAPAITPPPVSAQAPEPIEAETREEDLVQDERNPADDGELVDPEFETQEDFHQSAPAKTSNPQRNPNQDEEVIDEGEFSNDYQPIEEEFQEIPPSEEEFSEEPYDP